MQGLLDALGWPAARLLEGMAWLVGDMGLAIILLVLIVRAALLPLARRHYRMQAATARIFPQLRELHEELKDDPDELEQHMRALYRDERATPYGWVTFPVVQVLLLLLLFLGIRLDLPAQEGLWGLIPDLGAMTVTSGVGWVMLGIAVLIIEVRLGLALGSSRGRDRALAIAVMVGWVLGSVAMTPFIPVGITLAILTAVIWSVLEMRILARYRSEAERASDGVLL